MNVNKRQADDLLGIITGAYPSFELTKERVKIWTEMLVDIDFEVARKRVKHHIGTSKYAPTIAEILKPEESGKKRKQTDPDTLSPAAVMQGGYITLM